MITDVIVAILFAILGLAIISWVGILIPELNKFIQSHKRIAGIVAFIFNAAPDQEDASRMSPPVRIVAEGLIPIILWILILVPMIVFPIILIIFPLLHIPWTYLLPPTP
jgi:hypothetical protein